MTIKDWLGTITFKLLDFIYKGGEGGGKGGGIIKMKYVKIEKHSK